MYEECSLKGQKGRELKGLTLMKALEGRYAAKLTQFKIFQGLKVCVNNVLRINDSSSGSTEDHLA